MRVREIKASRTLESSKTEKELERKNMLPTTKKSQDGKSRGDEKHVQCKKKNSMPTI